MSDILSALRDNNFFMGMQGASFEEVESAQTTLQLSFADDYSIYVREYGIASFEGHELTGICNSKRLNVVDVTKNARESILSFPKDLYVVEETNIDDIIICQDCTGAVYQTAPNAEPVKIADNLCDYINM